MLKQKMKTMPTTAGNLPMLRAAYSDRTAALMAKLADLAYEFPPDEKSVGTPAITPVAFRTLGFQKITYFHNGWDDGWAYVVEGPDIIVVAFRGTATTKNWGTNFQVSMVNPPGTNESLRVHHGFFDAFNALANGLNIKTQKLQKGLRQTIDDIMAKTEGKVPIFFTGHSLGGALAQIATAVFGCDQVAACYTFGSPRVGNKYFDLWVKPPSYRIENYADIVPQVPYFSPKLPIPEIYRHSGDARYLPYQVDGSPFRYEPSIFIRFWQLLVGLVHFIGACSILGIADHSREKYVSKLAAIADERNYSR